MDYSASQPNLLEVTPEGVIVWELDLNSSANLVCYRSHHRDWNPCTQVDPQFLKVKNITATSAKIDWEPVSNAISYDVQYRQLRKIKWKLKTATLTSKKLTKLIAQTAYEFHVRAHCPNTATGGWSTLDTFTTVPQKQILAVEKSQAFVLQLHPNPVENVLTLQWNPIAEVPTTISILDITGKLMFKALAFDAHGETTLQLDVTSLPPGFYFAEMNFASTRKVAQFIKQ